MQPMIDTLEGRRMFSFTFTNPINGTTTEAVFTRQLNTVEVSNYKVSKTGTLFLSTTGKADKFSLVVKNGKIIGGTAFAITLDAASDQRVTATSIIGNATKIKRIDISTLGGNDNVTVIADVPVSIRSAAGNDALSIFAPSRTIEGGSGSNIIREGNEAAGDAYLPNTPFTGLTVFTPINVAAGTRGLGYVFSDKFLTDNAVETELTKPVKTSPRGG